MDAPHQEETLDRGGGSNRSGLASGGRYSSPPVRVLPRAPSVRVNVSDQEDSGEDALQDPPLQRRGAEPQRVVGAAVRIRLNVEDVQTLAQRRRAAGGGGEKSEQSRRKMVSDSV